jgi:uncharacterized protein (TIGR02246 family)
MRLKVIGIGAAALLIALLASTVLLHGQAPTAGELRRLADAYSQAWAKGDAKALAGLHTTEAIRIGLDGRVAVGRAAIEQALLEALRGPFRGTKVNIAAGQTARAAQDVYVSEGTFHILGGLPPAGVPTRGRYLHTLVRLNGRWLIAGDAPISPAPVRAK